MGVRERKQSEGGGESFGSPTVNNIGSESFGGLIFDNKSVNFPNIQSLKIENSGLNIKFLLIKIFYII